MTAEAITAEFPSASTAGAKSRRSGARHRSRGVFLTGLSPACSSSSSSEARSSRGSRRTATSSTATRGLDRLLQADRGLLRRYAQFKTDFERINTPEVAKLFAHLDEARDRLDILEETAATARCAMRSRRSDLLNSSISAVPG